MIPIDTQLTMDGSWRPLIPIDTQLTMDGSWRPLKTTRRIFVQPEVLSAVLEM